MLFKRIAFGIMYLFFGVMAFVTFIAFSRKSGSTGQDMATVQQIRAEAAVKGDVADSP